MFVYICIYKETPKKQWLPKRETGWPKGQGWRSLAELDLLTLFPQPASHHCRRERPPELCVSCNNGSEGPLLTPQPLPREAAKNSC